MAKALFATYKGKTVLVSTCGYDVQSPTDDEIEFACMELDCAYVESLVWSEDEV